MMKITAYAISDYPLTIRPASSQRNWINDTNKGIYRCLPLNIASSTGWELLCPYDLEVAWNGGSKAEDLEISDPGVAVSHFGNGILTFSVGYIFRTEAKQNLWVRGPVNSPKDGISPLEGIVETHWLPFTFTMNWKITRPNVTIRFAKDEPFCTLVPYPADYIENFEGEIRKLADAPDIEAEYRKWRESRNSSIAQSYISNEGAWEQHYFIGRKTDGEKVEDHKTKVNKKPFKHS